MTREYVRTVDRLAIVGDARWQEWAAKLSDTFAEAEFFAPEHILLASEVGLASASSVHHHVRVLEAAEVVERRAGRPRTTRAILRGSGSP